MKGFIESDSTPDSAHGKTAIPKPQKMRPKVDSDRQPLSFLTSAGTVPKRTVYVLNSDQQSPLVQSPRRSGGRSDSEMMVSCLADEPPRSPEECSPGLSAPSTGLTAPSRKRKIGKSSPHHKIPRISTKNIRPGLEYSSDLEASDPNLFCPINPGLRDIFFQLLSKKELPMAPPTLPHPMVRGRPIGIHRPQVYLVDSGVRPEPQAQPAVLPKSSEMQYQNPFPERESIGTQSPLAGIQNIRPFRFLRPMLDCAIILNGPTVPVPDLPPDALTMDKLDIFEDDTYKPLESSLPKSEGV